MTLFLFRDTAPRLITPPGSVCVAVKLQPEIFHLDVLWRGLLAGSVAVSDGLIKRRDDRGLCLQTASSGDLRGERQREREQIH